VTVWENFAADLYADFLAQGLQLDMTNESMRECREMWIRKKKFSYANLDVLRVLVAMDTLPHYAQLVDKKGN